MDVGIKEWRVSFRMFGVGHMFFFSYGQAWHGKQGRCVSSTSSLHLFKTPEKPSSKSYTCGGGGLHKYQ